MKRLLAKIGRFFWSRGFLKFCLWTVTLIVLFYVEEDWRGSRAWAATKAKWEAKGESFDFNKFIPADLPDAQNLGALPLFKLELDPNDERKRLAPLILRKALRGTLTEISLGSWAQGERPDNDKLTKVVAAQYTAEFKKLPANLDSLAQLDALYPFLSDIRKAAETRPRCRFQFDNSGEIPAYRSLELTLAPMKVARLLALHAILALHQHQADLALSDLRTIYQLLPGVERDPTLVGALVAAGMATFGNSAIYEGLLLHAWDDGQLAKLQELLRRPQFLADYQFAMRACAADSSLTVDYIKRNREIFLHMLGNSDWDASSFFAGEILRHFPFWPTGWIDQNKSEIVSYELNSISDVDLKTRRVFPEIADRFDGEVWTADVQSNDGNPWSLLFSISDDTLRGTSLRFARAQAWADEAQIACGLERYHLAHGVYPEVLIALVLDFIPELPHDIMTGESYRYHLQPDGTFLLYSVGWNQKDDGGRIIYLGYSKSIDDKQGDWVWPTPKTASP